MSRAPREGVSARRRQDMSAWGAPYQRHRSSDATRGTSTSLVLANSSKNNSNNNIQGPRRLTFNNFATFNAREKKLPPDANINAAVNSKFWQLQERASFYCNKCRRDNIISDTVAIDAAHQVMLCTRCFTRIIRPCLYRPSRVVPFPSLLSWLNYTPSKVMDMSADIASRPAEAVAPSGDRVAVPTIGGGDRQTRIQHLPTIAMNTAPPARRATTLAADSQKPVEPRDEKKHPCCRVWGKCMHGETCLFRRAPYDLCLCYLMGLCSGDEGKCRFLHQDVFSLPNSADQMPATRRAGEVDDPRSAWGQWIARKKKSPNSAEWQLWHNGPVIGLLDVYAPVTADELEKEEEEEKNQEKIDGGKSAVKLNFADIAAALKGLRQ